LVGVRGTGRACHARTGSDLLDELAASADHVRRTLLATPPDLIRTAAGETWTTTKLLRRLTWHEPSELTTMKILAAT
jgi:hypothetical protein